MIDVSPQLEKLKVLQLYISYSVEERFSFRFFMGIYDMCGVIPYAPKMFSTPMTFDEFHEQYYEIYKYMTNE